MVLNPAVSWGQAESREPPQRCTYRTYSWSTTDGRAVNRERVEKPYSDVAGDERSPDDPRCTLCSEDQVTIDPAELGIDGVDEIQVCWAYAEVVRDALGQIAASPEFSVTDLTAYRVGRTRGAVVDGLRTELSNHSYGTAIDINAEQNGLYNRCDVSEVTPESLAGCRLGVGGTWDPEGNPNQSVVRDGIVHRLFTTLVGWSWGGEIEGRTRDMMHFSLTGY